MAMNLQSSQAKNYVKENKIVSLLLLHQGSASYKISLKNGMNLYGTRIAEDTTIMAPVAMEYSPDASGRYGLFICSKNMQHRSRHHVVVAYQKRHAIW
jgi:hypothetical protein